MTHSIFQAIASALTSPETLSVAACCGALLAAHCGCGCGCGHNHDHGDDDDSDADETGAEFNFSQEDLAEYKEFVEQTNARITELVDALDSGDAEDKQSLVDELVQCYLARAARLQEEGEDEQAGDDYAAAFARYAEYVEEYGESLALLKKVAAGRLNHGILLNDSGELDEADEAYAVAEEANAKLAQFGDKEAKLDLIGIRLNRASIAFERGEHTDALETLDDASEEFRKIAEDPESNSAEALFYLAKTYATKASFLRATLEEDDLDSPAAAEATETLKKGIDVYRALVNSGNSQYRRDLADALVSYVATSPTRTKEDLEAASANLKEACDAYQQVVAYGEQDACVDLFDAALQRGELLIKLERGTEAAKLYDTILETFESFAESGELPLVEGLAVAFQRRAVLRKGSVKPDATIADLTHAIELQSAIADSLIESLREGDEHEGCGCGCGHDHDHDECGCGGCGGHDHEGCGGCGGHDHEGCGGGCGGCCGGGAERKFLVERWANDNFRALTECFYERINAYLEKRDSARAASDCAAVEELAKAYHEVLKEGESLDEDVLNDIRTLRRAL